MKKLISSVLGTFFGSTKSTKKSNPVEWRFVPKKVGVNSYNIHMMAFIQAPWQIYTKQLNTVDGTLFDIEYQNDAFIFIVDALQEIGTPIEHYDLALKEDMRSYKVAVNFVQNVKVIIHEPVILRGTVNYMVGDGISKLKTFKKEFKLALND